MKLNELDNSKRQQAVDLYLTLADQSGPVPPRNPHLHREPNTP